MAKNKAKNIRVPIDIDGIIVKVEKLASPTKTKNGKIIARLTIIIPKVMVINNFSLFKSKSGEYMVLVPSQKTKKDGEITYFRFVFGDDWDAFSTRMVKKILGKPEDDEPEDDDDDDGFDSGGDDEVDDDDDDDLPF